MPAPQSKCLNNLLAYLNISVASALVMVFALFLRFFCVSVGVNARIRANLVTGSKRNGFVRLHHPLGGCL